MTETQIDVLGIETSVKYRAGEGPALICVHGNSLSQKMYAPLWELEQFAKIPLVTYDLPGHGQTAPPPDPRKGFTLPAYAAHLGELVSLLRVKEVILLGFSMGGHIALAALPFLGSAQKGLFTLGTPPIDRLEDMQRAFLSLEGGTSLFRETLTDRQISLIVRNITSDPGERKILAEDIAHTDSAARKYLVEGLPIPGNFHSEHDYLKRAEFPVVMAYGERDALVNIAYIRSERIRDLLGNRLNILKDCEHFPDWKKNKNFLILLNSFLDRIRGDTRNDSQR